MMKSDLVPYWESTDCSSTYFACSCRWIPAHERTEDAPAIHVVQQFNLKQFDRATATESPTCPPKDDSYSRSTGDRSPPLGSTASPGSLSQRTIWPGAAPRTTRLSERH